VLSSARGTERRRASPGRAAALLVALVATILGLQLGAGVASAHTEFDSSDPANGSTIDEPVEVVTVSFTNRTDITEDSFVAFDSSGVVRAPNSVDTVDDKVFQLRFDPPLAGGRAAIRWKVSSADSHSIEGSFSFTVTAPAVAAPTTPVADATTNTTTPIAATTSIDEFLETPSATPGQSLARAGRTIGFLGATIGIGALAFVAATLRGRKSEVTWSLTAVRALGGMVAVGAAIEYVGVSRLLGESLFGATTSSGGIAALMRLLGGAALAFGLVATVVPVRRRPARSLSAAVTEPDLAELVGQRNAAADEAAGSVRWKPDQQSWPAFTGVALIVVSFWFDGHTVSKGFRPLHAVVNSVHLLAGSIWVGGVVLMAIVVWRRSRAGRPTGAAELALRFSPLATVSLVAVAAAGLLMTVMVMVMDSFGELTGTEWGKILLLKVAAVALAGIGGAYNHFRLIPALDAEPDNPMLLDRVRSTITAEAILLVFVVIVTAALVAAAS
jgi:copper transport protein